MRNRVVGMLIIGVSVLMGIIILSFNEALKKIVSTACDHGPTCPMWGTLELQTNISVGVMSFVVLIGIYLIFFGEDGKFYLKSKKQSHKPRKVIKADYGRVMNELNVDEKKVLQGVISADGTIFQSELVEKIGFTKVKVTRILDKLEGKGVLERRRRGMSNVVILKHK